MKDLLAEMARAMCLGISSDAPSMGRDVWQLGQDAMDWCVKIKRRP